MASASPVVGWSADVVEVVLGGIVVVVVRQSDVLVGRVGAVVVVIVSRVSTVVARSVVVVEVLWVAEGRREQPTRADERSRTTEARISARVKRERGMRFMR